MTATNHAITGALVGFIIGQPLVAIPVAFISHFICDAIPHYGTEGGKIWSTGFKRLLLIDASLCVVLVAVLASHHPAHWALASLCAFLAASPDFYWAPKFIYGLRHHRAPRETALSRFLGSDGIQWFQKPIGAVVEAAWFLAGISFLVAFVK